MEFLLGLRRVEILYPSTQVHITQGIQYHNILGI